MLVYLNTFWEYLNTWPFRTTIIQRKDMINYCARIRPTWLGIIIGIMAELSDQKHMSKNCWQLTLQNVFETQMRESLSNADWTVTNVEWNNLLKVVPGQSRKYLNKKLSLRWQTRATPC